MYDPKEANKTYMSLLAQNGASAAVRSAIFVGAWYLYNHLVLQQDLSLIVLLPGYIIFCIFFTWKPKLIRFLRGVLRGSAYRDKSDLG